MNQSMFSDYHQNAHSKYLSKTKKNVEGSYTGAPNEDIVQNHLT